MPSQRSELDLYFPVRDGDLAAVRSLLKRGADVQERYGDETTPLHVAASSAGRYRGSDLASHTRIVQLLLEAGADPNAVSLDGDTPYDVAGEDSVAGILGPLTTPVPSNSEDEVTIVALRGDLETLRQFLAPVTTSRARKALVAAARKRVVRWQWLSNVFSSPEPHYSERMRFPKPRVLRREPTDRELRGGVTQLGLDRDGRRVLEREVIHSKTGLIQQVVYDHLEPDLVAAVFVGTHDLEGAWCARVEDGRPQTKVHAGGGAEVYRWEGRRLGGVEHWSRLNRRPRRSGREELTHDALGRLLEVVHVGEDGRRSSVFRRKAKGESLKTVAAALRAELVRVIPQVIHRAAITEPAYCLAVTWSGAVPCPPFLAVGLERERANWQRTSDDSMWSAPEFELFATESLTLDDPDLVRVAQRMRELLDRSSTCNAHLALYRDVARDLNRVDWSGIIPVTDNFVVFPSDLELVGLSGHLRAVLGKRRARELEQSMGCPPPD